MSIFRIAARTACAVLPLIVFQFAPAQGAETSSDSDRLEKLERAVQQLQQRNTELEAEVKALKQQGTAFAPPAEGPTKKQVISDGKTYVEKSVPVEKTAADKWKLSAPITELELYGDVRLRYEYRAGQTDDSSPLGKIASGTAGHDDWIERERERYRIRLGLRGTLLDDWFFGLRLETSQNPRSTNVTFGDDTTGSSTATNNGPFSKTSDGINVGQAYVGYKGFKDIVLMGGRMPLTSVLVTTRMVWDDDLNPEGLSEQWKHSFSFGTTGDELASYSKDGKGMPAPKSEPWLKLDLFANFNQFVYDGTALTNPLGPRPTHTQPTGETQLVPDTNAFLLASQVGAKLNFPKTFYLQLAPTIYNYTGNGTAFDTHFQGGDPALTNAASMAQNQTGINSLLIYDMPWEVGWKVDKLPMRIFGDFAVNFEGDDRARAAGHPSSGDQRYAVQAGVGVGQLKKKHDWQVEAFYQRIDQYALDPNLIDSDLFEQQLNLRGPVVRAGYMFSDAVWLNLTWGYAWRADRALGTGGIGDIAINPIDQFQIFQADLNLKF
jgi:Putative porin